MSRFSMSVAVAALLSIAACGGDHNCQDAVNANAACAAKLNTSGNLTLQACNSLVCANKQGFINCIVNMACPDVATSNAASAACLADNGCQ